MSMENKDKKKVKKPVKNTPEPVKERAVSQDTIRKGLTIAVTIFGAILIVSIVMIFVVSKKIDSMTGADAQIKLSAQGGFTCEYSEAQKLYPSIMITSTSSSPHSTKQPKTARPTRSTTSVPWTVDRLGAIS